MKIGVGISREKSPEAALSEAYRKSLQRLKATKADYCLVFYSYDYALDQPALSGALKKALRDTPHAGCSTWGAWANPEGFEAETALMVVSFKEPGFEMIPFKVHSLREKAELWSTELSRQIEDSGIEGIQSLWVLADSLNFTAGSGFQFLERKFPKIQFFGAGISFSVPQCSVVCDGEVHLNSLLALGIKGSLPWLGLLQSVKPELKEISINRMSENLVIEIDEKPAFYKLCEHLMTQDDLPMMSPDEFRKHMGNLYVVEKPKDALPRLRSFGESYRVISLLGSEMTTGMVAVAQTLDFSQAHQLAQKKMEYADELGSSVLEQIHKELPKASFAFVMINTNRLRDRERGLSDEALIKKFYPDIPVIGLSTNGEFLGGSNQFAALVILFP